MNNVVLVYSDGFRKLDFGQGHPMRGDRYGKALDEFRNMGLLDDVSIREPKLIPEDIIGLFHTQEYINQIKQLSELGEGVYGGEVPAIKGLFDIILLSVSASVTAADYVLGDDSFDVSVNICGGWHHAFESESRGFCIFNDVAVTANYLVERKNIDRIMVLDYDAHHGDGTQRAFYGKSDVYTVSFHQDPSTIYPFRSGYENEIGKGEGEGFNQNYCLSSFCGDDEFISRFSEVSSLIDEFRPGVLILQMGVDGSRGCTISNMQLTSKSYDYASSLLMRLQKKHNFKTVVLGGGGFVHPMLGQHWGVQLKNFLDK